MATGESRRRYGVAVPHLHRVRRAKLLSARELASAAGVNYQTVLRLEQGTYTAQYATVRKLAAALGVDPTELTGDLSDPGEDGLIRVA